MLDPNLRSVASLSVFRNNLLKLLDHLQTVHLILTTAKKNEIPHKTTP